MGNGHGYSIDLEIEHDTSNIVSLKVMIDEIRIQRPKKSKLSGWQTLTRKNFPDEVRKLFSRQMHQKSA